MSLLKTMLYNVNGEPEIGRVITWVAAISAIFSPVAFMGCAMAFQGVKFDPVAWCTAYPGGLAALVASGILSIGKKDKDVEAARATKGQG
ncbi:hypothetical protein [Stakelama pacifica]|uniref:Holin n=1 Tax=Stakelama pacifica TaxID=517720 RepID=A0A4R6FJZ1_9SPHN|nr:hypothetical protein [Stakelama pacifica]TDN81801.1 hypothetical protein EV664_107203 [Stakelama pacifica]